ARSEGSTARAARSLRKGPRLLGGAGAEADAQPADGQPAGGEPAGTKTSEAQPAGIEPAEAPSAAPQRYRPAGNRALASALDSRPLTSRPLINPHLRSDPRLRIWITRLVVAIFILAGFAIGLSWRVGLTVAIIYIAADSILRSKTMSAVPPGVRVTSAQR